MQKFIILFILFFIPYFCFSEDKLVSFDDKSLITIPTSTPTPIYKMYDFEIEAWDDLKDVNNTIERCKHGLKKYPNLFRKQMDDGILKMQKVIASLHTAAVLHKRDNVEFAWEEAVAEPEKTLEMGQGFIDEFDNDIKFMEKKQKKIKEVLDKKGKKMQNPNEIKLKYNANEKEIFFIKKEVKKFKETYKNYEVKFKMTIKQKENKIETLIAEHKALHKP